MCLPWPNAKTHKVYQVHNSEGISDEPKEYSVPEHADSPFVNKTLPRGVLGFSYETKTSSFFVYSSIEAKTFCYLMRLTPFKN